MPRTKSGLLTFFTYTRTGLFANNVFSFYGLSYSMTYTHTPLRQRRALPLLHYGLSLGSYSAHGTGTTHAYTHTYTYTVITIVMLSFYFKFSLSIFYFLFIIFYFHFIALYYLTAHHLIGYSPTGPSIPLQERGLEVDSAGFDALMERDRDISEKAELAR
jgi:hypothetical protein